MAGKIKAAVDARHSNDTLIIARTDAVAVEGFDRAIERAVLYRDAGADLLFVEAPKAREDLADIVKRVGRAVPLMANMVEGGKTPMLSGVRARSARLLAGHFPRRHRAHAGQNRGRLLRVARRPRQHRSRSATACSISTSSTSLIGTPEMIERGRRLGADEPEQDQ